MNQLTSNRKFVVAWMTCETVGEVARKLKLTNVQVSAKANGLRKKGVKLPTKQRGEATDSVDELNAIVAKYTPEKPNTRFTNLKVR